MILNEKYVLETTSPELKKEVFPGASMIVDGEIQQGIWLLYGPPNVQENEKRTLGGQVP